MKDPQITAVQVSNMPSIIKEITETQSEYGNSMADFEIVSELGRGSYGVVYKVKAHKDHDNVYALKKIPMKHMKLKHQREALQEMLLLKKLSHPHIIQYYASFLESDCLHILMEYAAGGDLYAVLKKMKTRKKYFAEKEIWRYAYEIGLGLGYLHSHNIIHRDIKCLNIFLNENRTIKIGDLGVSKIVASSAAMQGTRVGTPLYLSPELVKQQPYDFKVDIWAAGCVLYHIACLEPPFSGENLIVLGNNIVSKQPNPMPSVYSARLHSFVGRLMAKKAVDRPSVNELMKLLPEPYKKESGMSEGGTEEEAATLATGEGLASKQQVRTQAQKFLKAVPSSPSLHRKSLEQDSANAKSNIVKIVNAEMFQEHLKPKQDNYMQPYVETNIKPKDITRPITVIDPRSRNENAPAKIQQKPPEPVLSHKILPKPVEEDKPTVVPLVTEFKKPVQPEKKSQVEMIPHPPRYLICPIKRPETVSQKTRPTLSLFRSINVHAEESAQQNIHPIFSRPTSAGIEQIAHFRIRERLGEEDSYDKRREKPEIPLWQRPQSAMPLGKPVILPTIARSSYQTNRAETSQQGTNVGVQSFNSKGVLYGKVRLNTQFKTVNKRLTINDLDI